MDIRTRELGRGHIHAMQGSEFPGGRASLFHVTDVSLVMVEEVDSISDREPDSPRNEASF